MAGEKKPLGAKGYWGKLVAEVVKSKDSKGKEPLKPVVYEHQQVRRSAKYQLSEALAGVYFTQREADCMMQMLNGKTMNEAGKCLNLSPRTVEYYLLRVKRKLKCRKKRELIALVAKTDFAKNFLNDPYNQDKKQSVFGG